jgi:hypothetical protein
LYFVVKAENNEYYLERKAPGQSGARNAPPSLLSRAALRRPTAYFPTPFA